MIIVWNGQLPNHAKEQTVLHGIRCIGEYLLFVNVGHEGIPHALQQKVKL